MRKFYFLNHLFCVGLMLYVMIGCHQEPLIPKSAIPHTCQLYKLTNVDESIRDTTTYTYNDFGNIEKSTYRKWISGQIMVSIDQSYIYTTEHYLTSQTDQTSIRINNGNQTQEIKGYLYTYQNGRVQEVKIINGTTNATLGFKQYVYEGDNLKTYTETDANKVILKRYTFDSSGKLVKLDEPVSRVNSIVSNGKITKKIFPDSTIVTNEYDSQGQLIKQNTSSLTGRTQYTYSYDTNPYWTKTQLRLRGIPSPDLGENLQIHNLKGYSFQIYQNDKLIGEQKINYNHAYNKDGYSQGYGRSDGIRQASYYINCP